METSADIYLPRYKPLKQGLWLHGEAMEEFFGVFEKDVADYFKKLLSRPREEWPHILQMAGSLAFYSSQKVQDLLFGKTAYTGETTIFPGLWTAALDDTFNGATANEANYTSYARMSLTNNTTNFPTGSGTTTYSKSFPGDAAHNFATSTGGTSTITYLGLLNGNAGSSADKGIGWCSVTSTTINNGDTPVLAQNAITVTQD
jgi:hypothetical protein